MTGLDPLESELLTLAREHLEPAAADASRLYEQLAVSLGLPVATTVPAIPVAVKASTLVARPGVVMKLSAWLSNKAMLAVACAGLGGTVGLPLGYVAAGRVDRPSYQRSGTAQLAVVNARASVTIVTPPPTVGIVGDKPSPRNMPSGGLAATLRQSASDSSVPSDPLAEELRGVQHVEQAIRGNNGRLALALLDRLDATVPQGRLMVERTAARVMADCLTLAPSLARVEGEDYLRQSHTRVYHERVRQLCGLDLETHRNGQVKDPEGAGD